MNQKIMPTEESHTQKNTLKMISFVWNFITGKTNWENKQISGYSRMCEWLQNGTKKLWSDENAVYLDWSDEYIDT